MDWVKETKEKFAKEIKEWQDHSPQRIYITIEKENLVEIACHLFENLKFRFIIASGVDTREEIEILYHFSQDSTGKIVSLRVLTSKDKCEVDSLAPYIKGTNFIEREIHELLGVDFKGHPDLRRLLLAEDWPEGKYPLRRDYKEEGNQ